MLAGFDEEITKAIPFGAEVEVNPELGIWRSSASRRSAGRSDARYWHKADIRGALHMSAFGGKADMLSHGFAFSPTWRRDAMLAA